MAITLNGTTGITNGGGYTGDGVTFADGTPSNTLVTDTSGNVGVGTASPTTRLSVVSATNAGISVNDGTVNTIIYNSTGGVASIGTTTNHPVDFYSNNAARMRLDTSGNLQFNSGYGSVATAYGCRAWVNFNGTGTVAIRGSGNVSSITDNGIGRFTVNFTNAMPDANYAAVCSGGSSGASSGMGYMYSPTVNGTGTEFVNAGDALLDPVYATVSVFR